MTHPTGPAPTIMRSYAFCPTLYLLEYFQSRPIIEITGSESDGKCAVRNSRSLFALSALRYHSKIMEMFGWHPDWAKKGRQLPECLKLKKTASEPRL
jgi:hypothetical protein